ncbi:hypothetical protein Tco_0722199 [Tanacetum coccineum]
MAPRGRLMRLNPDATPTPVIDTHTTTSVTNAQIQAMINEGVTATLAARDATRNGDDSHTSGTVGTMDVVGLTQWFEKMESVYSISNCTVACQVKFATCTLQGNALYMREFPRISGIDVVAYSQRFQELALMCDRMFPEEIDQVEKYVGGLPDTIHGSVMATKPKTMQDAIEFATELMDKKINTWAERQADNKRRGLVLMWCSWAFQDGLPQMEETTTGVIQAGNAIGIRQMVYPCGLMLGLIPDTMSSLLPRVEYLSKIDLRSGLSPVEGSRGRTLQRMHSGLVTIHYGIPKAVQWPNPGLALREANDFIAILHASKKGLGLWLMTKEKGTESTKSGRTSRRRDVGGILVENSKRFGGNLERKKLGTTYGLELCA